MNNSCKVVLNMSKSLTAKNIINVDLVEPKLQTIQETLKRKHKERQSIEKVEHHD